MNINNLGFFWALQSKYHCNTPNDAIDISKHVKKTYDDYDHKKINQIWLSVMGCYNGIIECNGGNNYKIPHFGKDKLEQIGQLPAVIPVTKEAFKFL